MRIAIVEDDPQTNKQLNQYVEKYYLAKGQTVDIVSFFDGEQISENYKCDFDIILMDIEMKFVDGISAAEYIRKFDEKVVIIFITNSVRYAVKCYVVNAQGYIVKPVTYFALSEELARAEKQILHNSADKYVLINTKNGAVKYGYKEIVYVESDRHRLILHTVTDTLEIFGSVKSFEELVDGSFFRCNNCYLVNLRYVSGIEDCDAVLSVNGKQVARLLISRARKKDFLNALTLYCGGIYKNGN